MIKFEFHFSKNTIEGGTLIAILLIVFIAVITIGVPSGKLPITTLRNFPDSL